MSFLVNDITYDLFRPGDEVTFALRVLHFALSPCEGESRVSMLKSFLLRGPVNLRSTHGNLMAVQVRSDGEGHVFGHGTLKVIDWVKSSAIMAREDFETSPILTPSPSTGVVEFSVELVPSEHGVVSNSV